MLCDRARKLYPNPGFPIYESVIRLAARRRCRSSSTRKGFAFTPTRSLEDHAGRGSDPELAREPDRRRHAVEGADSPPRARAPPARRDPLDEIYARLTYDGEETCPSSRMSPRDRTILLDG
jgi:hypothetical protein